MRPTATYRLQLHDGFGFDDAARCAEYLAALGISHVYLSPVLLAAPGSRHGYDVVDHTRLSAEAGGAEAYARMTRALDAAGLSVVLDIVPNHMAVPTPASLNRALWSVLRDGPGSQYAPWFDVDWSVEQRALLMPVLGDRIGAVLAAGELTVGPGPDGDPVLRYGPHLFPLRPGTEQLPLEELVDQQWYRLAWWRVGAEELNYRRFFDVDTLAAIRVEDEAVFDDTHALVLELVARGEVTGLRVDHPDGLADPRGYLRRLAERCAAAGGDVWLVVEKILHGEERLPADWPCAGTTGYDSLSRLGRLFADPAAEMSFGALQAELTGEGATPAPGAPAPGGLAALVERAKREVLAETLMPEVSRLVDLAAAVCQDDVSLRDHTRGQLQTCLVELLVAMDRYRAYVVPGEPAPPESVTVIEEARERARALVPSWCQTTLDLLRDLALDRPVGRATSGPEAQEASLRALATRQAATRAEFAVRFQQTCGPVMAKSVEDTAYYRWHRLVALNEVGGDPDRWSLAPEDLHDFASRLQRETPETMTALSTHDTKRSEDVRARLFAATELAEEWAAAARAWCSAAAAHRTTTTGDPVPDSGTVYLTWQTLVGTWDDEAADGRGAPLSARRLATYLAKATHEAKLRTSWTAPDPVVDEAVREFAHTVLEDDDLLAQLAGFCALLAGPARAAVLGQKLVQLTMPGVADTYQGCELVDLSLVDPDNRRPVDVDRCRTLLAALDAGTVAPGELTLSAEKLLVTSRALRLRREHPDWFRGAASGYTPLATTTGNAVAFGRGPDGREPDAVTVVTRLPVGLARRGGWDGHTLTLPPGRWRNLLGDNGSATVEGGATAIGELLARRPVALLVRA